MKGITEAAGVLEKQHQKTLGITEAASVLDKQHKKTIGL